MTFPRTLTPKGTGRPDFVPGVSGTVNVNIIAQGVMTAMDIQARYRPGTAMRDRQPLGPGSIWVGSWQDIENYQTKTYEVRAIGSASSFAVITGMMGTGVTGATGTYFGPTRIGAGSRASFSFREAHRYTRPYLQAMGGAENARGSYSVMMARQT